MTRSALIAEAERSIRLGSKSFYLASRLFDRRTRERAWLLYAWCRHCDDQCDGQSLGHPAHAFSRAVVEQAHALTSLALQGLPTGKLPYDALALVLTECDIPHRLVLDHLAGYALDHEGWRPHDQSDLIRYCYHVAGSVGCMMAIVMGVSPCDDATLSRACDLGIAFQLCNIARDIADDHAAGRCYIPACWLKEFGIDAVDPLHPDGRRRLVQVVRRLVDLADRYAASARQGIKKLEFRSRWAIAAASHVYCGIGHKVVALGPAAWDQRVIVAPGRKLGIVLSALCEAAAG